MKPKLYSVVDESGHRYLLANDRCQTEDRAVAEQALALFATAPGVRIATTRPGLLAELDAMRERAEKAEEATRVAQGAGKKFRDSLDTTRACLTTAESQRDAYKSERDEARQRADRLGTALGYAVLDLDVIGHGPGGIDAQAVVEAVAHGDADAVPRLSAADHTDAQRWRDAVAAVPLDAEALARFGYETCHDDIALKWDGVSNFIVRQRWVRAVSAVAARVMAALASDVAIEAGAGKLCNREWGQNDASPLGRVTPETRAEYLADMCAAFAAQCKAAGVEPEEPGIGTAEVFQAMNKTLRTDLAAERQRADRAEKRHTEAERLLTDARGECRELDAERDALRVELKARTEERDEAASKLRAAENDLAAEAGNNSELRDLLRREVIWAEARGEARLAERLMSEAAKRAAGAAYAKAILEGVSVSTAITDAIGAALAVARTREPCTHCGGTGK